MTGQKVSAGRSIPEIDMVINGYRLDDLAPYFRLSQATLRRKVMDGYIALRVFRLDPSRKGDLYVSVSEWKRFLKVRESEGI